MEINEESEPLDVIMYHRKRQENSESTKLPAILTRRYSLYIKPLSSNKPMIIRNVKGSNVGHLITVSGIVTRVSDVKPFLAVNTYSCDRCGCEVFQEINTRQFTPLVECPSAYCKTNNFKGSLHQQTRASKFLKFQEVKIQEMTDQVPMGHIPRTMTVYLFQNQVRTVNPGDSVYISGIFLPLPHIGFRAIRAGLITDTYLEAHYVHSLKKQYNQLETSPEMEEIVNKLANDPDVYNRLASSIAPEIYGHEDVKKALLLLLVGGASKETGDGMKIRGDINICLMGDPGVAKSQLLKYISKSAPRGVYTTGRGSSGVGLTASVMRDPVTDEMVLEGGALVLADNGIACIDEFDKMDEDDRTAIHEVMEQQTISISKAGITTTLNARTSILAAANPAFGRYNPNRKPSENINLPAALLSRFDLLFLILDTPNINEDHRLAQHIGYVHIHNSAPKKENNELVIDSNIIRHYIAKARNFYPTISPSVGEFITNLYIQKRIEPDNEDDFQYTCARTLLSVIRLSSALARIRFSNEVTNEDVEEALRLIQISKESLRNAKGNNTSRLPSSDAIYSLCRDMARAPNGSIQNLSFQAVLDRVRSRGWGERELRECISKYSMINVWQLSKNGKEIKWVSTGDDDMVL
jgi:DNA replication licensing factor MCM7